MILAMQGFRRAEGQNRTVDTRFFSLANRCSWSCMIVRWSCATGCQPAPTVHRRPRSPAHEGVSQGVSWTPRGVQICGKVVAPRSADHPLPISSRRLLRSHASIHRDHPARLLRVEI